MKALSGITVIDLTEGMSGPYCSMMMADLGAEVIKVEPLGGDIIRNTAPVVQGGNPVFTAYNRNKKSIALDIKKPEGMALVKKLLEKADLLLDSYQPGVMEELGLDYDTLKAEYPRLVCVSLTGYGKEGPYRDRPVYEGTLQAECGMTQSLINDSNGTPYYVGGNITQYASAYVCFTASLAALHQVKNTGCGQKVDVNMYSTLLTMFSLAINDYLFNGVEKPIDGNAPEGFVRSKDGWLRISFGDQPMWERAVKLIDDPIMHEEQYNTAEGREPARKLLLSRVEAWTLQRTSAEAVKAFEEAGLPGGIVRTTKDLRVDPHLVARNHVVEIDVDGIGKLPYFASPFRIRSTPIEYNRAPALGEHSDEILEKLASLSQEEIAVLKKNGVVA